MNAAYLLQEEQLRQGVAALLQRYTVIAPVRQGEILSYLPLTDPAQLEISDLLPYASAKAAVLPQIQPLLRFQGGAVQALQEDRPVLLLLAKPCDVQALAVLDAIFDGAHDGVADPFYQNRRKLLTVVGLACEQEKPGCFCRERGIDPSFAPGCDLFLTPTDQGFLAEELTLAGAGLFRGVAAEPGNHSPAPSATLQLQADEEQLFAAMPWQEYAEGCIGCGVCAYLCPTCHCFMLRDQPYPALVQRSRLWDSCMYPRLTLHGSGHNPRNDRPARLRQRVLHKYVYLRDNIGQTACTGCGRCIRSCPGGVNIRRIVADIRQRTEGGQR